MFLIVDGNNVAWAGFYAVGRSLGMDSPERKVRAALIGLTQSVLGLVARAGEPPDSNGAAVPDKSVSGLAIAFDHGRPWRRRELYARYQTGRESDPNFVQNEPYVLEAIDRFIEFAACLPCTILRGQNTEADDLVAAFAAARTCPLRIASTDRDFLQLIDERVSVYSPVKRVVVNVESFAEHACPRGSDGEPVRFPRERYLEYRAASGDNSDDLPGIPGVGALTAARLVARHPIEAYVERPTLITEALGRRSLRVEEAFRNGEAARTLARNLALMDLRRAAAGYRNLAEYETSGSWDESAFRRWIADQRATNIEVNRLARAFGSFP